MTWLDSLLDLFLISIGATVSKPKNQKPKESGESIKLHKRDFPDTLTAILLYLVLLAVIFIIFTK